MRYLYLWSLLLLIVTSAVAQEDFQAGYIISLERDTVTGLLRKAPSKTPARVCEFKTADSSQPQRYGPGMISGFGYLGEDRYFESFDLPSDDSKEPVFAELLFRGRAHLYWFDEFFYLQKDSAREIIDKVSTRESNSGQGRYVYTHKIFIGTLNRYFYDCLPPKLLKGDVVYSEKDFVDVFRKYSECSGVPFYEYKQSARRKRITYQLLAGLNHSSIRFPERDLDIFSADNSFFVGGGIEAPLSMIGDGIFLTGELMYHRSIYSGKREGFTPTGAVMKDYTVDLSVVKLPIGIKLNFSKKAFTPYLRGGLTPFLPLGGKWTIENNGSREGDFVIDEKTASLVYWGAFGFQKKMTDKKRVSLELRLEKFIDYIGFYGPQGATNIPSTVINKMLVCGFSF